MNKQEQISIVIKKTPEEIRPIIPRAYELVIEILGNGFSKITIPLIIEAAGWIRNERKAAKDTKIVSHSSPEQYIRKEKLIETIEPEISEIRIELYGKAEPLFPQDIEAALEWLTKRAKEEAGHRQKKVNNFADEISTLEKEIKTMLKKLSDLTLREYSLHIEENPFLPIPYKVGKLYKGTDYLFLFPGTSLAILEGKTRFMSKKTNFAHQALIIYVLTGIKPLPIAYKIKRSASFGIEFFILPSKGEFDKLYHKMRNKHFERKGNKLKDSHKYLYKIVIEKGGEPEKGIMNFWEEVRVEFNKKHPGTYKDPRGPKKAYKTILKKLS